MPGLFLYVTKLILSISCLVLVFSPIQADYPIASCPDTAPTGDKDLVFQAMVNSFELYSSFLNDIELKDGYPAPCHGRTREAAIQYLSAGFTDELAIAIVDEYTLALSEVNHLVIRPCDGLPVITNDDLPFITCQKLSSQQFSFFIVYNNCYFPGDSFGYRIEMKEYNGHWKISALNLDEI